MGFLKPTFQTKTDQELGHDNIETNSDYGGVLSNPRINPLIFPIFGGKLYHQSYNGTIPKPHVLSPTIFANIDHLFKR